MLYIKRDKKGNIIAVYNNPQPGTEQATELYDREILNFFFTHLKQKNQSQTEMLLNDLSFIRVVEDLIEILINKNVINITDFPKAAIAQLSKRKKIRKRMAQLVETLSDEDDKII